MELDSCRTCKIFTKEALVPWEFSQIFSSSHESSKVQVFLNSNMKLDFV